MKRREVKATISPPPWDDDKVPTLIPADEAREKTLKIRPSLLSDAERENFDLLWLRIETTITESIAQGKMGCTIPLDEKNGVATDGRCVIYRCMERLKFRGYRYRWDEITVVDRVLIFLCCPGTQANKLIIGWGY